MLSDKSRQALSDEELMRQYLAGDDKAFETVYARRREGLRRFLERQCGSAAIGQELAQDAWFKLIRACQGGQYTAEAKFTTFLYRVARNTLIDWYRKHGNTKIVDLRSGSDEDDGDEIEFEDERIRNPEEAYADAQNFEVILSAIEALPEVQRTTLLMFLEGEMSYEEIAEAMDTKRETVKTRLRYARATLKQQVYRLQ